MGRGRLASSFLFCGPEGVGKRSFALKLAQTLLCHERPAEALDPCGTCPACVQVTARTHPDLNVITKPKDKSFLPLELLIGDKEHRMRRGLCHDISLKPFMGGRKVALIDDADYLNSEGANCLLKTLEEPPPRSVLILISTSPARQLPTIRSRCQLIRFLPLAAEVVARLLIDLDVVDDEAEAVRLAGHSGGSIQRAVELADAELWSFRSRLYQDLSQPGFDSVGLSAAALAFVNSAGKSAADRRGRMRQVIQFVGEFYRQTLLALGQEVQFQDAELRDSVGRMLDTWSGGESTAAACLDRCLEASEQVDRNANQATLLECWLDDLAGLLAAARR